MKHPYIIFFCAKTLKRSLPYTLSWDVQGIVCKSHFQNAKGSMSEISPLLISVWTMVKHAFSNWKQDLQSIRNGHLRISSGCYLERVPMSIMDDSITASSINCTPLLKQIQEIPLPSLRACKHMIHTIYMDTDIRRTFYLSWCSWFPQGLWYNLPDIPHNETQQCGIDSQCIPLSLACISWVTELGLHSHYICILCRYCQNCNSHCHTRYSLGQCIQFCICHMLGHAGQVLKREEKIQIT